MPAKRPCLRSGAGQATVPKQAARDGVADETMVLKRGWADAGSVFFWQHDRDGGLGVINIERAADGDQLDQLRGAVVVADIEGKGQACLAQLGLSYRKAKH